MIIKENTRKILAYIRQNTGRHVNQISKATGIPPQETSTSLSTLFSGRYVSREHGEEKNASGHRLYTYTFLSEKPRARRHKGAVKPMDTPAESQIEIMIAIKGGKETTVVTLTQARDLVRQLKALGEAI